MNYFVDPNDSNDCAYELWQEEKSALLCGQGSYYTPSKVCDSFIKLSDMIDSEVETFLQLQYKMLTASRKNMYFEQVFQKYLEETTPPKSEQNLSDNEILKRQKDFAICADTPEERRAHYEAYLVICCHDNPKKLLYTSLYQTLWGNGEHPNARKTALAKEVFSFIEILFNTVDSLREEFLEWYLEHNF